MTWVEAPADYDQHSLAEFIEAELMFSEDDYLSLTELRALFPSGRQPTDDQISFAFTEIEGRRRRYGGHYPYLVDDRGVLLVWDSGAYLYSLLLLLSLKGTPLRIRGEYPRSDPLFDAVVREGFKAWLGPGTEALVFGWPPRDGRPNKFDDAVEWAGTMMGLPVRKDEVPSHLQDGGVDIVLWRPFPDGRAGFEIYLVQDTVQMSFRNKPHDVRPLRWLTWCRIATPPAVGFAVPFAMPTDDPWWCDVTDGTTIPMDRERLVHALCHSDPRTWPEWPAIQDFVDAEIADVRAVGTFSADATVSVVRRRK